MTLSNLDRTDAMVDADMNILNRTRILLVDSDDSILTLMTDYFRDITRLFTAVKSAEEALPLLDGPLWDVVICNLKLPGINGLEFSKLAVRQKPGTKIILATQHNNHILKMKAADYGVVEIAPAPLTPENLLAVIVHVHTSVKAAEINSSEKTVDGFDVPETVSIKELDESMIIKAFIRFGPQYQEVGSQLCTWIKHNFKGARAVVERKYGSLEVPVEEIRPGDDIKKLFQFPITLMNLTFVRKQLIKELRERDFLAFQVKRKPTERTLKQKIRMGAIRRIERLIGQVDENIAVRDTAGETIKEIISSADKDEVDTFDLVNQVDGIAKNNAAEALTVIAALKKSDHTYTHCVDVGAIFLIAYSHWIKSGDIINRFENDAEALLSAILHDIGKIFISKEILENSDPFDVTGPEMLMMRRHPLDGAKILANLNLSSVAVNMASYHHVKVDTTLLSSYPSIDRYSRVAIETRLLAVADMYQALVGRRPYKRSWHPSAALKYIDGLCGIECDLRAWVAFREAFGQYPVGSMVRLNDGSQAFVVERAAETPDRPLVAVARNSFDEELTHNTFIDLNIEKDIHILKGLDHFSIYGDQAIKRFSGLRIS